MNAPRLLRGSIYVGNKNRINCIRVESKPGLLKRVRLEQQNTSFLSVKKEICSNVSTILSSYTTYFERPFTTCSRQLTY